jgi:A/G-specific adenine glycosylase
MRLPIDNNIARLVSRVFHVKRVGDTRREIHVSQILDAAFHTGDSRQITLAMLDLAGVICTAAKPKCMSCPLQDICAWNLRELNLPTMDEKSPRCHVSSL